MAKRSKRHHAHTVANPQAQAQRLTGGAAHQVLQRAQFDPASLTPQDVKTLQRAIGNRATTGLIQFKLQLGPAGDQYEQEADQVADQVMRTINDASVQRREEETNKPTQTVKSTPLTSLFSPVQRTPSQKRVFQKSTPIQREFPTEKDKTLQSNGIQREALHLPQGGEVESGVAQQIQAARGGGSPLEDGVRRQMENGFRADFSQVRVHTGGQADILNRSINARAFTTGKDIFFGQGEYKPGTRSGQKLIAHELTHTVQQTGSGEPSHRAAAQRQPASNLTIQRRMDFDVKELGGSLSKTSKVAGVFSGDSTFSMIQKELRHYWRINDPDAELASLQKLKELATQWLANHQKDKKKDASKEQSIKQLQSQVNEEIQRFSDSMGTSYVQQIENKSLKYMTKTGHRHFGNLKKWHEDDMSDVQEGDNLPLEARDLMHQHGLTLAEAGAIGIYTADDYRYINPSMAKNQGWLKAMLPLTQISDDNIKESVRQEVTDQHVQDATQEGQLHGKMAVYGMLKLPDWKGKTFRGLGLTEEDIQKQYAPNATTTFDAFTSTSTDKNPSLGFARQNALNGKVAVLLHLQLTKGKDIAKLSHAAGEKEILLMPGATFKVQSVKKTTIDKDQKRLYEITLKQTR